MPCARFCCQVVDLAFEERRGLLLEIQRWKRANEVSERETVALQASLSRVDAELAELKESFAQVSPSSLPTSLPPSLLPSCSFP